MRNSTKNMVPPHVSPTIIIVGYEWGELKSLNTGSNLTIDEKRKFISCIHSFEFSCEIEWKICVPRNSSIHRFECDKNTWRGMRFGCNINHEADEMRHAMKFNSKHTFFEVKLSFDIFRRIWTGVPSLFIFSTCASFISKRFEFYIFTSATAPHRHIIRRKSHGILIAFASNSRKSQVNFNFNANALRRLRGYFIWN